MSLLSKELFEKVKGGITLEEAKFLSRLASKVSRGCIVEVGSFRGLSALALAQGVREGKTQSPASIYCIEPHRSFVGVYGGVFGPADRGAFFETMIKSGAFNEIALVNLTSEEVVPGWRLPVGLLFIDGDHRYEAVRRDLELWDSHLITGGVVALDDVRDEKGGPHRVARELIDSDRYEEIEGVGKIVALKKVARRRFGADVIPFARKRLLVVCHDVVPSGGLLRFDKVGTVLRSWGHDLSFVSLSTAPKRLCPLSVPLLTLDEAGEQSWDAVMVPGAGFPSESIECLKLFQAANYGTRVQHILNDQNRRKAFRAVNVLFAPHVVIFNNEHWPVGSFTDFTADRFHVLLGAVDAQRFNPPPYRRQPLRPKQWIVGGLAKKNPGLLIDALEHMVAGTILRLFGPDPLNLGKRHEKLVVEGRLELTGPLFGRDLQRYYTTIDCVAMTESEAGWSNLVAEAMASGVPVVCTRHGTTAFASDGETALLADPLEPAVLAAQLQRLRDDPEMCRALAIRARETIEQYSWERYAQELLSLIQHDGRRHYIYSPEEALFGKWSPADRLQGLQPLLQRTIDLSVIDLGAAEGTVAREFLRRGASLVHGFDLDPERVETANSLSRGYQAQFRTADLSDWDAFINAYQTSMYDAYDIVLHLGLHQHLSSAFRLNVLRQSVRLAKRYVGFRAPAALYRADKVEKVLREEGFAPMTDEGTEHADYLGSCHLFERV